MRSQTQQTGDRNGLGCPDCDGTPQSSCVCVCVCVCACVCVCVCVCVRERERESGMVYML